MPRGSQHCHQLSAGYCLAGQFVRGHLVGGNTYAPGHFEDLRLTPQQKA